MLQYTGRKLILSEAHQVLICEGTKVILKINLSRTGAERYTSRLHAVLSPQRPMFRSRAVHVGFIFCYCYDGVRLCLYGTAAANGPIVHPPDQRICSSGRMILTGENLRPRSKTRPSATLSITNLT
jgi:hypothetical protein